MRRLLFVAAVLAALAGCLGAGPGAAPTPAPPPVPTDTVATATTAGAGLALEVVYSGMWSGAWGPPDAVNSGEGFGNATLPLPADAARVRAVVQKQESNDEPLTLRVVRDGAVLAEASGAAPLAVVTLEAATR